MFHRLLLPIFAVALAATAPAQVTIFSEDFENGLSAWRVDQATNCGLYNCNPAVTWQILDASDPCSGWALPFPSGNHAVWFGLPGQCNYDGGPGTAPHASLVTAQPIALPSGPGSLALRFYTKSEAENRGWDVRSVQVTFPGVPYTMEVARIFSSDWYLQSCDLTPFAGMSVGLRFEFSTSDDLHNDFHGWYVDDIRIEALPGTGVDFCSGDGTVNDCPCGNFGAPGHGCATSFSPGGILLSASGTPDLSSDTLVLNATGLTNSLVVFCQGTMQAGGGHGVVFGDGLRCIAGALVRLKALIPSGGAAQFPGPGDPAASVAGRIPPTGAFRTYQLWSRDTANFCTASTFNQSNGLELNWAP